MLTENIIYQECVTHLSYDIIIYMHLLHKAENVNMCERVNYKYQ